MDSKGNILNLVEQQALTAEQRAQLVPIPDNQLAHVQSMNRKKRRAYYAKQRKAMRAEAKR